MVIVRQKKYKKIYIHSIIRLS